MTFIRDRIEGALVRANFNGDEPADAVMAVLRDAGLDAVPDEIPPADGDYSLGSCEWPTRSGWRTATCGRSGSRRSEEWGIRLCWQHEDAVISEALARIAGGTAHDAALEALVKHVVTNRANDDRIFRPQHVAWRDAIDDEIVRRLERRDYLNPRVKEAFDDYIAAAIKERWSA